MTYTEHLPQVSFPSRVPFFFCLNGTARLLQVVLALCFAGSAGTAAAADRLIDLVAIPDLNGNSSSELVTLVSPPLREERGSILDADAMLYVRDAASGASIGDFPLVTPGWNTLGLLSVPQGNRVLIGVLQQHAGGAIRVTLRHAATGAFVRDIRFLDTARTALAATFVRNAAGPGAPGVAVLALNRPIDNRSFSYRPNETVIVEVRRAGNGESVRKMYPLFWPVWDDSHDVVPMGIAPIDDQNGNGSSEIAVLAHVDETTIAVVAHDARTGTQISPYSDSNGAPTLLYLRGATPIGFAPLDDASGDGQAEIAVLGQRDDRRSRLQLREVMAGTRVVNPIVLAPTWEPRFVRSLSDVDGNGAAELAMGALRGDGRITVDVHDGGTGTRTSRINFLRPGFDPRDLEILGDLSANGVEELALIGHNPENGVVRIQIRDARSGNLLRNIGLP